MIPRSAQLISVAAFVLTASSAIAHDVWLTVDRNAGGLNAQINNGDTDRRELPDRNRVVALDLVTGAQDVDLRKPLTMGQRYGQPVLETTSFTASGGALLSITYDNGYWIDSPKDKSEINSTRLMVPGGTSQHWTVKYGKLLLGPGAFSNVVHTRLELIPLKDPFTLRHGQELPVRLVMNGKPVSGVKIAYGDGVTPIPDAKMPFATTGRDGVAEIPLARKGAYLLTTDYQAPPLRSDLAEYDHLYASLTFDVSKQAVLASGR
jgi:uncharacterized GH25 family protein